MTNLHLADAFIQSDLQCIQVIHFLSVCVSVVKNIDISISIDTEISERYQY